VEKNLVIISTKDKPIWQIVLAAIFFTIAIFLIGLSFYNIQFSLDESLIKKRISLLELIAVFTLGGISFSVKNSMFFDLEKKKFKDQFSVGPFKIGKWQDLPPLNYVSVFSNTRGFFEINLWYNRNKHFNIYTYYDKEEALETGYYIANQLHIKLLDATKRNNYTYLDMNKLKEKYKNRD